MASFNVQRDLIKVVRQGMKETNQTQADLARAAGISVKHVNGVLNGKAKASIEMWQKLIDAANGKQNGDTL